MAKDAVFTMTEPQNRLIGAMPKIGIRPTIDGREAVRGGIQEQTLNMAKGVAELISAKLRHANGLPVECVIADECIGGCAEAAMCADKFAKENVAVTITVTPCWCYGSETMDMDPMTVKAIWGFNGTERPGAVYLAAALAGHNQKGLPAFSIYGHDVQDSGDTSIPGDVQAKLLAFAKAGLAVATMRGKTYLSCGNVSMGIAGSAVDHGFFEKYLGMRVMTVDMIEFARRIEREVYDVEEYERALAWVKANCQEGTDTNPKEMQSSREELDKVWEACVKMTLIGRDLMVGNPKLADKFYEESLGNNAIAGGFQGQRQWTDHMPNGDFLEAWLTSSFDWNGIREPFVFATENDSLNAVVMLFGHLLTNTAQVFADVRTYWSPAAVQRVTGKALEGRASGGIIHLINSGPAALDGAAKQMRDGEPCMKPFWEITLEEAKACLDATSWQPAERDYFRAGGFSSLFLTDAEMPVTLARINIIDGLGPALQIAEGYTVKLPKDVHGKLDQRTSPNWPTTWFAPRLTGKAPFNDVYTVMANWGANHGAFSYGHVGAHFITLASMLRIPVCMHNVPDEAVFRPHAWGAFGAMDAQGADYRACEAFGPLYG